MDENKSGSTKVIVAMDFSDDVIAELKTVSPDLRIVRHWPEVPESAWSDAEILYTLQHFPQPEQAPRLRWIQLHYAGIEGALRHKIVQAEDLAVTSGSGIHVPQMAHYCLMMMMAFTYRLPLMLEYQARAEWPDEQHSIFEPDDLSNKTLGIAGYGSVGRELARAAQALGMRVLASKRDPMQPEEHAQYTPEGYGDSAGDIPDRIYPGEALLDMARECDFLVITLPLTDETRHVVNADVFEAMKPGAYLINVARGSVVDEAALISALAGGQIAGAALDVFEEEPLPPGSPLWQMDNVIISPHVAGNSLHYHEKAAQLFAENLRRYLNNQPLLNQLQRKQGY